jgi:hypothetical protein
MLGSAFKIAVEFLALTIIAIIVSIAFAWILFNVLIELLVATFPYAIALGIIFILLYVAYMILTIRWRQNMQRGDMAWFKDVTIEWDFIPEIYVQKVKREIIGGLVLPHVQYDESDSKLNDYRYTYGFDIKKCLTRIAYPKGGTHYFEEVDKLFPTMPTLIKYIGRTHGTV